MACAWRDSGKPQKDSVRIAGLWAEMQIHDLPNTKHMYLEQSKGGLHFWSPLEGLLLLHDFS
jgi:hypothetical protein